MKRLFLLLFLLVAGCAGIQKVPQEQTMTITKVVQVPGMTKDEIFNKTNEWVTENLQAVSADIKSGIILAEGEVDYPAPDADRVDYTFVFTMKNEIREDKNYVTFGNIMLKFPTPYISEAYTVQKYTGGEEIRVTSERDRQAAEKALEHIAGNLSKYLKGTAEPLVRCATCGAIFTSPECLTEHLKHHPQHRTVPGR
ncbi:MAG TPA: DUF4468 domain-containing protein [Geobacteraceae bacterium]|nr:DUF4468 domain-containing protein [Geobacteraceae bacterium]